MSKMKEDWVTLGVILTNFHYLWAAGTMFMVDNGFWFKRELPIYPTGIQKVLLKTLRAKASLWVCVGGEVLGVGKVVPVTEQKEKHVAERQASCWRENSGRACPTSC